MQKTSPSFLFLQFALALGLNNSRFLEPKIDAKDEESKTETETDDSQISQNTSHLEQSLISAFINRRF